MTAARRLAAGLAAALLALLLPLGALAAGPDRAAFGPPGTPGSTAAAKVLAAGPPGSAGAPKVLAADPPGSTVTEPPELALDPAGPPELTAESYILMDASTGQVLAQKDPDSLRYPASTTKLMTIALVLEECGGDFSPRLTVSESAVAAVGPGSSSIFLRPGETLTLEDAVWAALLRSANDAANVLAEHTAGSIAAFVARMNEKAAELGLQNTHFANPSGYHDEAHYTTARELALITRWALTVPGFAELLGGVSHTMPGNPVHPADRQMITDNQLLLSDPPYQGLVGGKSGWTPEAHFTMVEVAARAGHTLIAVTLACPRKADRFAGCAALLDYGFDQFVPVQVTAEELGIPPLPVVRGGERLGEVPLDAAAELLVPADDTGPLSAEYLGPPAYDPDEPFDGQVAVYAGSGRLLALLEAAPRQPVLTRLLQTSPKPPWDKRGLQPIILMALFIVLGAVLLSQGALRFDTLRRDSARRRLRRIRSRGLARIEALERAAHADEADGPQDAAAQDTAGPPAHGTS